MCLVSWKSQTLPHATSTNRTEPVMSAYRRTSLGCTYTTLGSRARSHDRYRGVHPLTGYIGLTVARCPRVGKFADAHNLVLSSGCAHHRPSRTVSLMTPSVRAHSDLTYFKRRVCVLLAVGALGITCSYLTRQRSVPVSIPSPTKVAALGITPAQKSSVMAPVQIWPETRHAPASCDWILPILDTHGLPTWMSAVAWRESRCTADAHNRDRSTGDNSYGLFQINTLGALWGEVQWRCELDERAALFDAGTNVACASALYDAYGYRPWDQNR